MLPEAIEELIKDNLSRTNCAWPAIVESFDSVMQTVSAQVSIKRLNGKTISLIVDAPISIPTCQGFHLTLPVKKGDECLLIISDRCIDNWFDKGGIQTQAEFRIHDISDGFALIGINSKPNKIPSYNANDAELRNTDGDQYVRLKANKVIEVVAPAEIDLTAPLVKITGNLQVTGTSLLGGAVTASASIASPSVSANGKELAGHVHAGQASAPLGPVVNTGVNQ